MHLFTGTPKYANIPLAIKICSEKNVSDIPKEVENHQKVLEAVKGTTLEKSKNLALSLNIIFFLNLNLTFSLLSQYLILCFFRVSLKLSNPNYDPYVWHAK